MALLRSELQPLGGEAWDFLPSHCVISSNALVSVTGRILGRVLSDGGTSTRRPAHDGAGTIAFDGSSDYITGTMPSVDGASAVTLLHFATADTDDAVGLEVSDGVNHIVELGSTAGYHVWCRYFVGAFSDARCTQNVGATPDLNRSLGWRCGVVDFAASPVNRYLGFNARADMIERSTGSRTGVQTASGTFATGTQVAVGGRISGASLQAQTCRGVIVVPVAASLVQMQRWVDYFNAYLNESGLSTPKLLRREDASDCVTIPLTSNPERWLADIDTVSHRTQWEGVSNLRSGDVITLHEVTSLQAPISVSIGYREAGGSVVSYGNTDNAPIDGTWTLREREIVIGQSTPRLRLTVNQQAWAPSDPQDGTFLIGITLPPGRVFNPVTQTTPRRLCVVGDFWTGGADFDSPQADDDYMTEGLSWYFDLHYPGRIRWLLSDVLGYHKLVLDYGSVEAAAAVIAAQAPSSSDEIYLGIGYADAYLDDAEYANLAAFRSRIASFLTEIRASTSARIYFQTLLAVPGWASPTPTLGTVAQVRAAMAGAVSDSGINNVATIDGSSLWASRDAYPVAVRAAMGSW